MTPAAVALLANSGLDAMSVDINGGLERVLKLCMMIDPSVAGECPAIEGPSTRRVYLGVCEPDFRTGKLYAQIRSPLVPVEFLCF